MLIAEPFTIGMFCHTCGSFDYGIFYKEPCPDCEGERVLTIHTKDGKTYAYRDDARDTQNNVKEN
jgi:hypothetical protein